MEIDNFEIGTENLDEKLKSLEKKDKKPENAFNMEGRKIRLIK